MRKRISLYILTIFFLGNFAYGQSVVNQGSNHTLVINKGGAQIDSTLTIPVRANNDWFPQQQGNLRIFKTTGNLQYRKNGQWIEVGASSNNYYQTIEQRPGLPVGAGNHYILAHNPAANTTSVSVNGIDIPNEWFLVVNNDLSILHSFYPIDNTDTIKIKYSYHN